MAQKTPLQLDDLLRPARKGLILSGALLLAWGALWPAPAAAFWPFSARTPAVAAQPAPATGQPDYPTQAGALTIDETLLLYHQISRISHDLFASLAEPDPELSALADGVVVLSFVDQKRLDRTTSFGRYLAEQLMNELQQRRLPVIELRKSTEIRIREGRGEYGLSRNPGEIGEQAAAAAMLTGTYTVTARQVIVHARIIDNRASVLLASATAIIPRTEVVDSLLADPVSGVRPASEPMYIKRLEL